LWLAAKLRKQINPFLYLLRGGYQNSQATRPEGAAPHSPRQRLGLKDTHEPYALQGQKPNYYGVALTGRIVNYIHHDTQGVALGYVLLGFQPALIEF